MITKSPVLSDLLEAKNAKFEFFMGGHLVGFEFEINSHSSFDKMVYWRVAKSEFAKISGGSNEVRKLETHMRNCVSELRWCYISLQLRAANILCGGFGKQCASIFVSRVKQELISPYYRTVLTLSQIFCARNLLSKKSVVMKAAYPMYAYRLTNGGEACFI
ncbi:MAG: hypothetical protein QM537_05245 [Candidatus Symbiobacter sp.]|nr:hypothetical protein [Candidatus Symbiobacter sp.]